VVEVNRLSSKDTFPLSRGDPFGRAFGDFGVELGIGNVTVVSLEEMASFVAGGIGWIGFGGSG